MVIDSAPLRPSTLAELLAIPPAEMARVDMARANLLCTTGLPGADGLIIEDALAQLDAWAEHTGCVIEQHAYQFRDHPEEYERSEPYWRMLTLTTVLQQHMNIRYNQRLVEDWDAWDWQDSGDLLLHGLLGPKRSGTCASLPVLITAIARRLSYPLRLVHAPGHVFCRWDGKQHETPDWRQVLNIECHGHGMMVYPHNHYHRWPVHWTPELNALEKRRGEKRLFLRSLEPAEEVAGALCQRGHCLEAHGRLREAVAAYDQAAWLAPHNVIYPHFAGIVQRKMLDAAVTNFPFTITT